MAFEVNIRFEGPHGSGRSRLSKMVREYLQSRGIEVKRALGSDTLAVTGEGKLISPKAERAVQ